MKLQQTPLSLTPELIAKFYKRDPANGGTIPDAALSGIEAAMRAAFEEINRVGAVGSQLDPTVTPQAHALRVRDIALKAVERAAGRLDAARAAAMADIARIEAETSAPPAPRDAHAVQMEAEIRSMLRNMDAKARGAAIAKAISDGDDLVVGAFLRGPAMLTGVGEAEREMRRGAWRKQRHPEKTDRQERLQKAIAAVDRGGSAMLAWTRQITESAAVQLAQAGKDRADAALAALNQAAE
ncbi:hypothetical protein FJ938_13165 [Mesorhizobium sp. B2-4-14]|uniref:hypothetical protein n=1 Tax=Mesorhizobium sp. B2-4-14 TaxID=2589935 RepID=UPI001126968E|nr:hypothetical protein [Mesorhizobium sp. B2-4-14]TPL06423.1 hypothetical protein FJ938_13165 [Mesorhizobium sp. B2-4-14]